MLLALLSVILYVVITSYTTLNLKGMYATKNNFYIEKYFGESISLPLGSFYIALRSGDYSFQTLAFITRLSVVLFINNKRKYYCELSITKDNFDILEKNLKLQTETYLISLDEKDYATIFIPNIKYDMDMGYTAKIDFNKIERLKKENENKNNAQTQSPYISLEFCFCQQDFSQIPIARKDLGNTGTFINYSMVAVGVGSSELFSQDIDSQGVSRGVNRLHEHKLLGNFGILSYLFKKAKEGMVEIGGKV